MPQLVHLYNIGRQPDDISGFSRIKRIFAYCLFNGRSQPIFCFGFESSHAITMGHLGMGSNNRR